MAKAELVALEHLEWPDKAGKTIRVAPGQPIPDSLSDDDLAELRSNGAIGSAADHQKRIETAAAESNRKRILAEAEAAGLKVSE